MTDFNPTVLRERADRLDRMIGALALELPGPVWDDVESCIRNAAADERLLADLLDAIGRIDYRGWPVTDAPTVRCRIAAVLEALDD